MDTSGLLEKQTHTIPTKCVTIKDELIRFLIHIKSHNIDTNVYEQSRAHLIQLKMDSLFDTFIYNFAVFMTKID